MKKIQYIIFIGLSMITMSCEKLLDAPAKSSLETEVIFSTYDLARGAVDGIKMPMQEVNSYRGRFLPYYGMNTDIEWWDNHTENDKAVDLTTYIALPNNANMDTENNAYGEFFSGIEKANLCIQGLKEYSDPQPGTKFGELLGEAIVLRAIYYTDLLKAWGDVPMRFEPITKETMYIGKPAEMLFMTG
ncbi:MAG: RagB/SusD family nutrient uptake outer membrane protein [Chloroflexia bacterium]|nr:RagB/SusD family nutrient uptake outer membrane protein [Chloroflexia bacterium]